MSYNIKIKRLPKKQVKKLEKDIKKIIRGFLKNDRTNT